jgi:HPt (histidine-containing phosphotransfer) domain-containing protein
MSSMTTTTTTTFEGDVLNVERMWRELDDDRQLLDDLARQFRRDYPTQLSQLRTGLETREAERAAYAAHKLAGMVGVFSAKASLAAAHLVEDHARAGDLAAATVAAASLEQEVARLDHALDRLSAAGA